MIEKLKTAKQHRMSKLLTIIVTIFG